MNKKEVLVDTVFLEKLSCDGKNLDIFIVLSFVTCGIYSFYKEYFIIFI